METIPPTTTSTTSRLSSSPEANPLSIGEDLVPIRPAKLAGQTCLEFSGLLHPPLLLHEDLKDGCGGQLWPAGMVLAKYVLKNLDLVRGKVVLELGAGGGLVGLAVARALYSSAEGFGSGSHPIMITDLPVLLPLQRKNIEINRLPATSIISHELSWGSSLPDDLPDVYRSPDVILAADCVYFEPAFPLLLETLGILLQSTSQQTDENTRTESSDPVCLFCMKKRRKADMRFITTLKKKFIVQEIDARQEIAEEGGGIFLYRVSRKR